jgi:hypothetical protein
VIKVKRKRRDLLISKMLELLHEHPGGLPFPTILEHIERSVQLTEEESAAYRRQPCLRGFEDVLWLGTIAPAKAGWLKNERNHLSLMPAGRRALEQFHNPSVLIDKAASRSIKGWLSVNLPRPYKFAARVLDQLLIEYRLVRRVGLRQLFGALGNANHWKDVLPVQTSQRFAVDLNFTNGADVARYLDSIGVNYFEGGHTIYIPPASAQRSAFREVLSTYPANAGIKLIKSAGGVNEGRYLRDHYGVGTGESMLHRKFVYDHRRLSLVANLLYAKGVGPRLYDLVEIDCGAHRSTAYIVEHAGDQTPSVAQCEVGLQRIAELEKQGILKINLPDGFADEDFEPPTCNGNALLGPDGQFCYIDFQNFLLVNYEKYLENIAIEATAKSHFGDRSLLRGGTYLYQSIPGVRLPSRRKIEDRIVTLREMMKSAGLSVEHRLVLDFGCNLGMMMAQYLKLGAGWCHGWDRAVVTPHTERVLLALGCTRFSVTGGDIESDQPVEANLPEFLRPLLEGSVISYLAVRGHLGWLEALARIPWAFLIYEGHEDETPEQFEEFVSELQQQVKFVVRGVRDYRDGDCDPRTLAVFVRQENLIRQRDKVIEAFAPLRDLKSGYTSVQPIGP